LLQCTIEKAKMDRIVTAQPDLRRTSTKMELRDTDASVLRTMTVFTERSKAKLIGNSNALIALLVES
jgi:hypothetical protein